MFRIGLLSVLLVPFLPSSFVLAAKAASPIPHTQATSAIGKYANLAFKEYSDCVTQALELQKALDAFVLAPSNASLDAAKKAWIKARGVYSQTEAFRFYGGPIDEPKTGPESLINAWPIDEAYIDYVKDQPDAGIIGNATQFPVISKELLTSANQKNGERNVSTGFHAIEFLLWGQDLSLKNAGQRPVSDYDAKASKTAERRGAYLKVLSELLVAHLTQVRDSWDPTRPDNYGKVLAAEPLEESLRKIYTGMTNLSVDEMAGERMTVSLEKSDQENEQDCFSDNTLIDLRANEQGIHLIYFETGIHDIVAALDPKLAALTEKTLKQAMSALSAIPEPFDNVIASKKSSLGRKAAYAAIKSLQSQGSVLAKSGKKMGLTLNVQ